MAEVLTARQATVAYKAIVSKVAHVRNARVLIAQDLAELYGVEPRSLMQAVKRNIGRFPADFMFQLTDQEFANLKSQFVISSWGGIRHAPYAFSEQGVAMLSSVLHSDRAIAVNIEIMRAFVRMRAMVESHAELMKQVESLEQKYDHQFKLVFKAIYELMGHQGEKSKRRIGFT